MKTLKHLKSLVFTLLACLNTFFAIAQTSLWSVSSVEGNHNGGIIYAIDIQTYQYTVLHHF